MINQTGQLTIVSSTFMKHLLWGYGAEFNTQPNVIADKNGMHRWKKSLTSCSQCLHSPGGLAALIRIASFPKQDEDDEDEMI